MSAAGGSISGTGVRLGNYHAVISRRYENNVLYVLVILFIWTHHMLGTGGPFGDTMLLSPMIDMLMVFTCVFIH